MQHRSKQYYEMISRIQSGELNRAQASEVYAVNLGTLGCWIARDKLGKSTRLPNRPLVGMAAQRVAAVDPVKAKLLVEVTQKVLSGEISSCNKAAGMYPDISLSTLTVRVRKARQQIAAELAAKEPSDLP